MAQDQKKKKGPPRISGTILIILGLMMLFADKVDIEQAWPLAIILVGVIMIIGWAISSRKQTDEYQPPPPSASSPPPPPPPANG